jgi:hypothetical protein
MKKPDKTMPEAKPTGWPAPRIAKPMFRVLPVGNAEDRIPTAEGRHAAIDSPCIARKMISCNAVCDNPEANVNAAYNKHPVRKTRREPSTSAICPVNNRKQPQARE